MTATSNSCRRLLARGAVVLLASVLLVPGAQAERADRDQPMQIDADALRYESAQQRSIFSGNVVVHKGTIVMRGDQLEVWQDDAGNQSAVLTAGADKRAFFRQKRDGVDEFVEGEAQKISYNGQQDTVQLNGRAEMRRLAGSSVQDRVLGSTIDYDNNTEVYVVHGSSQASGAQSAAGGGRVRAILAPRSDASGAAGEPLQLQPAKRAGSGR